VDPTSFLLLLLVLVVVVFFLRKRSKKQVSAERIKEARAFYEANVAVAKNPETDQATLRGFLAMENPHDEMFFARLAILRALSQNPSFPVELQAAAINRVSQEESAAKLDKALKDLAKSAAGPKGFVGFSMDV